MNDIILEKAKELGEMIANSETKKRADQASQALLEDAIASDIINEYNETRQNKLDEFEGRQPTEEEVNEINEFLQGEFNKMIQNKTIQEYVEATREYEMLIGQMDGVLQHFIGGGEEHQCGGSCSSCGGCH